MREGRRLPAILAFLLAALVFAQNGMAWDDQDGSLWGVWLGDGRDSPKNDLGILSTNLGQRGANNRALVGVASWYGSGYLSEHLNRHTAHGEVFNPEALTAASYYHPFGTRLKVTNLETGVSTIVRVNDLGPHHRFNRILDLSRESFRRICPLDRGLIRVRIEEVE